MPYIYKRYEEIYQSTVVETEKEHVNKVIEDRKKFIHEMDISYNELKKHQKDYLLHIASKKQELDEKRKKEIEKSRNIEEWLHNSVNKSSFHKRVESEFEALKHTKEEKMQQNLKLKLQRESYAKIIDELYRPKPSE